MSRPWFEPQRAPWNGAPVWYRPSHWKGHVLRAAALLISLAAIAYGWARSGDNPGAWFLMLAVIAGVFLLYQRVAAANAGPRRPDTA